MGDKIFIILGFFVFFLVVEFVMMGAFQAVGSTKTKRVLRTLCQAFLAILIVGYLLLVGMSLFIGGRSAPSRRNKQRNFSSALLCYYCCLCLCMAY